MTTEEQKAVKDLQDRVTAIETELSGKEYSQDEKDYRLHYAAEHGEPTEVVRMLKAGANQNREIYSETPFTLAAELGFDEIAVELIKHKSFDPNDARDSIPLIHFALKHRNVRVFRLLLNHKDSVINPGIINYNVFHNHLIFIV